MMFSNFQFLLFVSAVSYCLAFTGNLSQQKIGNHISRAWLVLGNRRPIGASNLKTSLNNENSQRLDFNLSPPVAITPCSSNSAIGKARGLLTGIFDVSKAKDYSRAMNVDLAVDLLGDGKYIYNVALEENHGNDFDRKSNLTEVIKKAQQFVYNDDEVWDRDELKGAIQGILVGGGKFVYLLGSKDTGKSSVIEIMGKLNMNNVFVVNLGYDSNILRELTSVLRDRRESYLEMDRTNTLKDWTATGGAVASLFSCAEEFGELDAIMNHLSFRDFVKLQSLGVLINELVKRLDGKVTIIIDEAQCALAITPPTDKYDDLALESALALFTAVNKENSEVCIVL